MAHLEYGLCHNRHAATRMRSLSLRPRDLSCPPPHGHQGLSPGGKVTHVNISSHGGCSGGMPPSRGSLEATVG
eukprot:2362616-Rhodomonas_salina.2